MRRVSKSNLLTIGMLVWLGGAFLASFFFDFGNKNVSIRGDLLLNQEINITAKVENIDRKDEFTDLTLKERGQGAGILARVKKREDILVGDILVMRGKLQKPSNFSEEFDYVAFLANKGISYQIFYPKIINVQRQKSVISVLSMIRLKAWENIKHYFAPPESHFLAGIILGEKNFFSSDFKEKLNASGMRHLVAISGLHMTLLSVVIIEILLFVGFWRQQAFWLAVVFIFLFIIFVGSPASALRAGIMASLLLLAKEIGRMNDSSRAVILAATVMTLFNPSLIRFDLGFQLSFGAVLGIIFLNPILDYYLRFIPANSFKEILLISSSAQLGILPLLIWNFHSISVVGLLANLLLIGLTPFVMIGGIVFIIISFISSFLTKVFLFLLWPLIRFFTFVIEFMGSLDFAMVDVNWGYGFGVIYYLLLIGLVIWWKWNKKPVLRKVL